MLSSDLSFVAPASEPGQARLRFEGADFGDDYDRQPVGLSHNLSSLGLFSMEALRELKRPENHDPAFRTLMEAMLQSIVEARGGFAGERIVRLESSVFVTSAKTTTPFQFDPEIAILTQIAGQKLYHVSPPYTMSETELEPFYIKSSVEIGTVDAARRDPTKEMVFELGPGRGLHQPQNAPHRVETCSSPSISYSVVLETDVSRLRGRTRGFAA